MRLLIVEDEVRLADTLRQLLHRQGYTADVCYDGVSGLDNAMTGIYDLVVLDEVIDAYNLGTIQKEQLLEMMDKRPEGTELVITGHQYGMDISALTDRADYVTKFVKEKHPFDLGMPCRKGIEE